MRFASILIPYDVGTIASNADPKAAVDVGYHVKSTLFEVFGENAIRPWRLVEQTDAAYAILGWLGTGEDADGAVARARSFGIDAKVADWFPRRDAIVALDMHASPEVTFTSRPGGRRRTTSRGLPVAGPGAAEGLGEWFERKLARCALGLGTASDVEIKSANDVRILLRQGGRPKFSSVPRVGAEVDVVVNDEAEFSAFLAAGMGPLKHVGFGSVFPREVLDGIR